MRIVSWLALGLLVAAGIPQDPDKLPRPPEKAQPLPPVQDPPYTPVERRDLLQRFGPASPLEGFYRLTAVQRVGADEERHVRGTLAAGRQYLALYLEVMDATGKVSLQTAVRRYRVDGTRLSMTSFMGFHQDPGEDPVLDPGGIGSECGFVMLGTTLRLQLADDTELEFVRID